MTEGGKMRNVITTALVTAGMLLALFLAVGREASGEVRISLGYGYGFSNKDKPYDEQIYGDYRQFLTRTMRTCSDIRIRFASKTSPLGFSLEVSQQNYEESYVELYQGLEQYRSGYKDRFVYYGGVMDVSLFPKKKLNPYLGVGLLKLFYINIFGSGPPDYPEDVAVKLIGGARYRLGSRWNIDSSVNYLVSNGILSVRLGLEFTL
jgi:hypothetical protein